jgi:hypothetical protein
LQRKYQQLAYKSINNHKKNKNLIITDELKINFFELKMWKIAKFFWYKSVILRIGNKSTFLWIFPFLFSLLLFPPLLKDYIYRIFLILKFKKRFQLNA